MRGTDLVSFQDDNLENLRALILYKSHLASPELALLLSRVDNAALAKDLERIVEEAAAERADLEAALRDWTRHERLGATETTEISYRDVVVEWAALLSSAARRTRLTAMAAPTPEIRARLERVAEADERRAAALLAFL